MITITKKPEPTKLTKLKQKHPGITYTNKRVRKIKAAIRNSLLEEQGYVCCYCGMRIGLDDAHGNFVPLLPGENATEFHGRIEHVIPQHRDKTISLDYSNLCYSCSAEFKRPRHYYIHCDRHKGGDDIQITPTTIDCLSSFSFTLDGHINPSNSAVASDVNATISVLNLNCGRLIERRKRFITALETLLVNGDKDILRQRYSSRDANGAFAGLYFVALSIIRP